MRLIKNLIQHQEALVQFDIANKVSRTIGDQPDLMQRFDEDCWLKPESGKHSISRTSEDINHIVSVLLDQVCT